MGGKTQISGISTAKFYVGEKVKVFGISTSTDSALVPNPVPGNFSIEKVGTAATVNTYYYWAAEYVYRSGKVGICSAIGPAAGIGHTILANFND